jgi:DNA modification methylase
VTPYYADDAVTLYHGDCREITDWLTADVLVTDPPYGIAYSALSVGRGDNRPSRQYRPIANDQDFAAAEAAIAIWGSRPMAVFACHQNLAATINAVATRLERYRIATWHKANKAGLTPGNAWLSDAEFVVIGVESYPRRFASAVITTRTNVGNPAWTTRPDAYLHPAQKAISGMEQLLNACPPGVVADPFAGSGSTLVAARNLGREAIGVELDERYCETIAKRLAQDVLPLTC